MSGGGKAKYDAKRHALVWKFKKFPGESEASLMASVELIATTKEKRSWARPPIELQFQVPGLVGCGPVSGLQHAEHAILRTCVVADLGWTSL